MAIIPGKFPSARWLPSSLCVLGLVACLSWHILPDSQAGVGQAKSSITLRVDVDLVTVEVIVLDKKGDPVRNLKKENFRLFEDGKEQEISTFAEVSADSNQAAPVSLTDIEGLDTNRGKVVLILFDDSHISAGQLKITRDSAEKYVKEHMRPQDLFAVASFDISLKILQNFTHDGANVLEAIRQPSGSAETPAGVISSSASATSRDSRRLGQVSQDATRNTISAYQTATYRASPLLYALDSLDSSLAQIKGRKAILLYSEDFFASANIHSEFMKLVNSARRADVAFYTIDARGLNSLDGGGGGTDPQGGANARSARARQGRGVDIDWNQFEKLPMENILRPLARETGGLAVYNTSNFNQRLDEVDKELSNYYVLGFQSNNPKRDGRFRELEVKTDLKGATIKHRNGYLDTRPLDALASSKEERILLNVLASPTPATQLPVTFGAAYVYESPELARIPVSARIGAASVDVRKKGGQLGGDINIMGIAYAEDGSISARLSESQHILIDKETEKTFRKRNLVYHNYLKLRPGKYRLKLAVSDEQGKVGSAEQLLMVPPMPQNGLAASSLIVADQVSRLPDLVQNLQARLLEESDPLTFNGLQIAPSVDNQLPINTPLQVFFKLYNLSGNPEERKFVAKVQLLGEKGETQAFPPTPLNQNVFATGKTEAFIGIPLLFDKATPGKYKLVIVTIETTSNQSVTVQTDLKFQ